ncbi:hypothetical protein KCU88_g2905, partial [Aureobasidium melanogenum]
MGSSSSKVAGRAAGAARRQYPSTSSITNTGASTTPNIQPRPEPQSSPSAQVHPDPTVSPPAETRSEHVELDGRDPQFDSALRKIGPAKAPTSWNGRPVEDAFPTSSQPMQPGRNIFPSSAQNPAITLVEARESINKRWEEELDNQGKRAFTGRTLVTAKDIKEVLTLRDEVGKPSSEIEKQMQLKPGILDQLIPKRVVANA